MTEYLVLRKPPASKGNSASFTTVQGWSEHARVKAVSAHAAIREVAGKAAPQDNGVAFAAVPARSWKPRVVKIETTPKVSFS